MPHRARAEHWSHGWIAVCQDCKWLGGDQGDDETAAAREAEMHERGEHHSWNPETLVVWSPDQPDPTTKKAPDP